MSEPKRYEPSTQCVEPSYQAQMIAPIVREVAWGNYVRFEDYARLKAEVERLRKAGDAISLCLEAFWKGKPYDTSTNIKCFKAWNATKEGKQS